MNIIEEIKDLIFGNNRIEELKHYAKSNKWGFSKRIKMSQIPDKVRHLEFIKNNSDRAIKGFLYQDLNGGLRYIYDLNNRNEIGFKSTTIFHIRADQLKLPQFIISPKSTMQRFGNVFTSNEWNDVDKEFGNNFEVRSNNMNAMRMMITIQVAEIINKLNFCTIEGIDNHLIFYRQNTSISTTEFDRMSKLGIDLIENIIY